ADIARRRQTPEWKREVADAPHALSRCIIARTPIHWPPGRSENLVFGCLFHDRGLLHRLVAVSPGDVKAVQEARGRIVDVRFQGLEPIAFALRERHFELRGG